MTNSQDQVRQWGPVAEAYVHSSFHAAGPDLARLVVEGDFSGNERVLDLGCGAGHTSLACAPHVAAVVAVDVTPEMVSAATSLARERGVDNVEFRVADVQSLPFEDQSFDVVTSRVSAHHYADAPKLWLKPSVFWSPVAVFWSQTPSLQKSRRSTPSSTAWSFFVTLRTCRTTAGPIGNGCWNRQASKQIRSSCSLYT